MRHSRKKTWLTAIIVIVLVALIAEIIVYLKVNGVFDKRVSTSTEESGKSGEKWDEGIISYKGKKYLYNNNIKTYLFLGIDKDGEVEIVDDGIKGGQSDAMFLLVQDTKTNSMSIVTIHRNAMTMVDVYDKNGDYVGQQRLQICLQHGYGDGGRTSCMRTAQTVSRLFYNIPIAGYMSLRMDGVPELNDAMGGIKLDVLENISLPDQGVNLKKGQTKVLTGNEAYAYLRYRDTNVFDSASDRIKRQQQFLVGFMSQIGKATSGGKTSVKNILNSIDKYMVTNMDFLSLFENFKNFSFDEADMYSMPGTTVMGEKFEEFNIDDDAFYEQILKVFYEPVDE